MKAQRLSFQNQDGLQLAARLEVPVDRDPRAYAIFAHCFTCNKNLTAVRNIVRGLTSSGLAVLTFDFTALGESEGAFVETTFSSNITDILAAAAFLEAEFEPPSLLIGHSLGGTASLFAAHQLSYIKGVVTIGSPANPAHVTHLLETAIGEIRQKGKAVVRIAGRPFEIGRAFLDDLEGRDTGAIIKGLRRALLILHSPQDRIVGIDNAAELYQAAMHPKSFISLDGADHILTDKEDSHYVGSVIASWATRYLSQASPKELTTEEQSVSSLESEHAFTTLIKVGQHYLTADEPESMGGHDYGPSPYGFLIAGLGACTAMTLQMYARRKKWDLREVRVHVAHHKVYAEDCEQCVDEGNTSPKPQRIDQMDRRLELIGSLSQEQRNRLMEIANRCPVHRTLENSSIIKTVLTD